jgi:hypothetical protein
MKTDISYVMFVIQEVERLISLLSLLDFWYIYIYILKVEMGLFRGKPTIFQVWVSTRKFFKSQVLLYEELQKQVGFSYWNVSEIKINRYSHELLNRHTINMTFCLT